MYLFNTWLEGFYQLSYSRKFSQIGGFSKKIFLRKLRVLPAAGFQQFVKNLFVKSNFQAICRNLIERAGQPPLLNTLVSSESQQPIVVAHHLASSTWFRKLDFSHMHMTTTCRLLSNMLMKHFHYAMVPVRMWRTHVPQQALATVNCSLLHREISSVRLIVLRPNPGSSEW